MGAVGVLGLGALALAGASAFALGCGAHGAWERRGRMAAVLAPRGPSPLGRFLRRGVPPLEPIARWLLRRPAARGVVADLRGGLEGRGLAIEPEPLAEVALAALGALGAVAGLVTGSLPCGLAVAACAVVALAAWARTCAEKRAAALREEVPEALRSMEVCFRSGLSLVQTLAQTAQEVGGELGRRFDAAARRLEMGAASTEALKALQEDGRVPELAFVAVALDVQHQSGGSLAPVLEAAQESVESELDLLRSLKVQTAQAKLSARIVTLMPFLLVALFSFLSPGFLEPFFQSLLGMVLLGVALVMEAAGVLVVRRMLRADT